MKKINFILIAVVLSGTLYLSTTYATLAPLTPPPSGGYDAGSNSILDPGCEPDDTDCFVKEFQGWKLTGNAGTTAGTNFIGTTDAVDLVFKTDDTEAVRILTSGNVGIGTNAPGFKLQVDGSFGSQDSDFILINSLSQGISGSAYNFGGPTTAISAVLTASNGNYLPYITGAVLPTVYQAVQYTGTSGELVNHIFLLGVETSRSLLEGSINDNTDAASAGFSYALDTIGSGLVNPSVDMHVEKNGVSSSIRVIPTGFIMSPNNVFDLQWNTDVEKKFFFDYENDAIRMGSIDDNKWDTANLGSKSVAIGFADPASIYGPLAGPVASGQYSIALGTAAQATGLGTVAIGPGAQALGDGAFAFGFGALSTGTATIAIGNGATASELSAVALGNGTIASGVNALAFGNDQTFATGDFSVAISGGTTASGISATAIGDGVASGDSSFVFGNDVSAIASGFRSFVFGINTEASGDTAFAFGNGSLASGTRSFAFGSTVSSGIDSFAFGTDSTTASGQQSFAFGREANASGLESFAMGYGAASSGSNSFAIGRSVSARSASEITLGIFSSDYTPAGSGGYDITDRLFNIGNGIGAGTPHNAYTLWKDGSFAYNDDNFQNDNAPGTEQNMFYFNFGQHDGLGVAQTKRAIRLGSALNDEWDINSVNVGDRSIAFGFDTTNIDPSLTVAIASGTGSLAFQSGQSTGSLTTASQLGSASGDIATSWGQSIASGLASTAWGGNSPGGPTSFPHATGQYSTAWGGNINTASGLSSTAFGYWSTASGDYATAWGKNNVQASGENSTAFGSGTLARSHSELSVGTFGTDYTPNSTTSNDSGDRLVNIGNGAGTGSESDAFTILKSGITGIGYNNFETTLDADLLQVNGAILSSSITGSCALESDADGTIVCAPSDQRLKNNITDLSYGLNEIVQIHPVGYTFINTDRFGADHKIGFLAQELQGIIPEMVTDGGEYLSVNYATLTPVIVKAIQEMNLNITDINNTETPNTWRDALISWFGNVGNGIQKIFAKEVQTDRLCVGQTCVDEQQLQQLLQNQNIQSTPPSDPTPPTEDPVTDVPSDDPDLNPADTVPSDPDPVIDDVVISDPAPEQTPPPVTDIAPTE